MMNMQNGGRCLAYSNAHFGHPRNLNKPSRAANMMDGWETGNDPHNIFKRKSESIQCVNVYLQLVD